MDGLTLIKNAPWIFALSLVGVLGFIILLAVGLNMYRQERQPNAAPARPAWSALTDFLRRLFPRPAAPPPVPAASAAAGNEVLRVLRHPLTGRLVVEIAGRRYAAPGEITDPEVQQGLRVTIHDLERFLGQTTGAAAPPPPPIAVPAPLSAEAAPPPPPSAAPAEPAALKPLPPARPAAPPPLRRPSMNPFKQMQVLREMGAQEPAAPRTIAEQIDDVLQQLIADTPYAAREPQVRARPDGAVAFAADGREFETLEALPDDLQTVFREAIRQWETRQ